MKRFICCSLAVVLVFSLIGCRKNPGSLSDISSYIEDFEEITDSEIQASSDTETVSSEESENSDSSGMQAVTKSLEKGGYTVKQHKNENGSVSYEMEIDQSKGQNSTPAQHATGDLPLPTVDSRFDQSKTEDAAGGVITGDGQKTYDFTTGQKHTALAKSQRYYYSLLSAADKKLYDKIETAVENLESRVLLGVNLQENNKYNLFFAFMLDNPQYFYLGSQIGVYAEGEPDNQGIILSYAYGNGETEHFYGNEFQPVPDEFKTKLKAKKAKFDAEVEKIISTIPANAPDVVKEKLIYTKLILDSTYNANINSNNWDGYAEDNWTAYGVIINHLGVCESYSEAFQLLLNRVGINATGICGGTVVNNIPYNHKWSAVKLDGEWYACDVTFDDPINGGATTVRYNHFNLTDAEMKSLGYTSVPLFLNYPSCTGTKYSYINYFK